VRPIPLSIFLVATGLAGQAGAESRGPDQEEARALRERGEILPLASVVDRFAGADPVRLLHVELRDLGGEYLYQVEFLDGAGILKKLRVDARTGRPAHGAGAPR